MRAYFFGNMYLSSIQQGIQAAHVTADLMMKYVTVSEDYELSSDPRRIMAWEWAESYKTMILLNAGYGENIHNLVDFFQSTENLYPWSSFSESEEALDGATTSVGIILPEKIYEGANLLRTSLSAPAVLREEGHLLLNAGTEKAKTEYYSKWEADLMDKLTTFGLAK
jgi:hypothetical protein